MRASSCGRLVRAHASRARIVVCCPLSIGRAPLIRKRREQFRLVLVDQRLDHVLECPIHDLGQLVEGEIDAMIGDAALREVVGPDTLGAMQAEVWIRPWASVSGTRCTRCAPDSNLSRE